MNIETKRILDIGIPATIDNVLQTLVLFIDGLLIAKINLNAVSGVGIANSLLQIYLAVFISIGVGASSLIAQFSGSGQLTKVKKFSAQAVLLAIIIGILFGGISIFFAHPLLTLMGAKSSIVHDGVAFFSIVGGTSIFWALQNVLASMLRAHEDAKTPMLVSLIVNLLNVLFDLILIFGFGPIPPLGVFGAAIATSLARFLGTILLFWKVEKSELAFSFHDLFNFSGYRKLLDLSIPATLERLVMRIGQVAYFSFIVAMGSNVFAAHTIAGNIEGFTYMPGFGLAAAATTLAGMSFGAKDKKKTVFYTKKTVLYGVFSMMILGVIEFLGAPLFASWFTNEVSAIAKIVIALRIDAFIQPVLAVNLIVTGALQGMGDTKSPLYSTIIGMWALRVVLVWLLGLKMGLGIAGVWLAIGIDILIRAIFLVWRFYRKLEKR